MNITDHFQNGFDFEQILIKSRRQKVLASLEKYPHKSILEIGCGPDPIFPFCKDFEKYTVVDPSQTAKKSIKKYALKRPDIRFIPQYFEDVFKSLKEKKGYDVIILSGVLHEAPDPNKLLCAVYDVCQENTIVHINVPNVSSFHRFLALEMGIIKSLFEKSEAELKLGRITNFDKEALYGILEKNGFQVVSFGTYFVKLFSNEQMDNFLNLEIVDKSILVGLEKMIKYMPEFGCEMYVEAKKIGTEKVR